MRKHRTRRLAGGALLLALALGTTACDDSTDPLGPELESGSAVLTGQVTAAAPAGLGAAAAAAAGQGGVVVEVEGTASVDTTDANGTFRLEVPAGDGPLRIRFRKGALDATLELQGLPEGTVLRIKVELNENGARVGDSDDGDHDEFEGDATLLSLSGEAPARSMLLELREDGRTSEVLVDEESTAFESDGDLDDFQELLEALDRGERVEVEGDGRMDADGQVVAVRIKAETDDDHDDDGDDDSDDHEFEGKASFVSVSGDAPERTLRLDVMEGNRTWTVDVLEGVTEIEDDGDLTSFADILEAAQAGTELDVEGEGEIRDDGTIVAHEIEVETDGDDDQDEHGDDIEFQGDATFGELLGEAPERRLRLEIARDDLLLTIEILEGFTKIDDDGDYTSFEAILAAAQGGATLEVDGEGWLQDDGSIAAREIEVDNDD